MVYLGWDYKRDHSLTSATELTDYQVKILVSYSSGTSSGDTVYLDGKCKADFGDIRFADSDNNELSYWIESVSGTLATIWVKIPTINTTTIWIYYGNSSATTTSNGDTTFIFFDDFIGSSLDTSKWTIDASNGTRTVSNGYLSLYLATSSSQNSISALGTNNATVITGYKLRENTLSGYGSDARVGIKGTTTAVGAKLSLSNNDSGSVKRIRPLNEAVAWGTSLTTFSLETWYRFELRHDYSSTFYYRCLEYSSSWSSWTINPTGTKITLGLYVKSGYVSADIDWVYQRQYTATEPTQGAWSEEILNESYVDFESLYNVGEFVSFVSLYFVGESVDFSSKYNIEWLVDFVLKYHIEIETAFESIYKIKTDHNFTTCITSNDKKSAEFRTRVESVRSSAIRFEMT